MHDADMAVIPLELKFSADPATGEFEGYGAIYGSQDAHGDLILPGAFADSLAKRAAEKRTLPMYAQHGPHVGGDHLPVGVWQSVQEDRAGLKMTGQIAGMDTERGKTIHSLVKGGALSGLSIEFSVPRGGATYGQAAGQPKRTIKTANLYGVSLVADPAHHAARVSEIKSARFEMEALETKLAAGERLTEREWGDLLKGRFSLSNAQAERAVRVNLKSWPRDEAGDIEPEVKAALDEFRAAASAFPHP